MTTNNPSAPGTGIFPAPAPSTGTAFPYPLLATGALAMLAMYLHPEPDLGHFPGLFLTAALLVLSPILPTRLPDTFFLRWSIRLAGYGGVLAALGWPSGSTDQFYMKPEFMTRIGPLLAVELTLRAYLQIPPDKLVYRAGQALAVAACLFICATTTTDDRSPALFYLAPLFVLAALQTARSLSNLSTTTTTTTTEPVSHRPSYIAHRTFLILAAFSLALPVILSIRTIDRELTQLAIQVLQFDRSPRANSQIGLSDQPQLQSIFNPTPSLDRTLLLHNTKGERHIRVTTFAYYNTHTHLWGPSARDRNTYPFSPITPNPANPAIRITALTDIGQMLPVPTGLTAIDTGDIRLARDNFSGFHLADARPDAASLSEWTVTESSPDGPASPALLPPPNGAEGFLSLPPDLDPRIINLAKSIAGAGSPLDRLRRLELHLRSTHAYSLRYDAPADQDPLADFILNNRAAHCQYFASALTLMARAAGIPTRLVVGFYAHEPDGENILVRQRDAHAWVEAYIDRQGWLLADATPASGRPDQLFEPPSKLRKFWESITDLPTTLREFIAGGALLKYILPLFALGALIAAIKAILKRRNTPKPETYLPADPDLQTLIARIEKLLAAHNAAPTPTQTWRDTTPPHLQPLLPPYNALRFGHAPASIDDLTALLDQFERSESTSQHGVHRDTESQRKGKTS